VSAEESEDLQDFYTKFDGEMKNVCNHIPFCEKVSVNPKPLSSEFGTIETVKSGLGLRYVSRKSPLNASSCSILARLRLGSNVKFPTVDFSDSNT